MHEELRIYTYTIHMNIFRLNPRLRNSKFWLCVLLYGLYSPAIASNDAKHLSINHIPVCMNFGCKEKQHVALTRAEWDSAANWLKQDADSPAAERQQIKQAIGWMEVLIGRHTPTHKDVGGDLGNDSADFPGQLDCIDEANNTTTYLSLFQQHGLLKHHKVIDQAYRRAIFDQHWAGQIETLKDGQRWVVDSWFQNNGFLPYLQKSEAWEDIPFFTSYLDSSQLNAAENNSLLSNLFN